MRNWNVTKVLALWAASSLCIGMFALAEGGATGVGGGGDFCENRIKIVRDDIKKWILEGGPKELQLPAGLTVDLYSQKMLNEIERTGIQCVRKGDKEYPVEINGTAKTCRFLKSEDRSQIICDFEKFQSTGESNQYILVHHEYAGLAELENPEGVSSHYFISNQIAGYLVDEVVKRLKVGKGSVEPEITEGLWANRGDFCGLDLYRENGVLQLTMVNNPYLSPIYYCQRQGFQYSAKWNSSSNRYEGQFVLQEDFSTKRRKMKFYIYKLPQTARLKYVEYALSQGKWQKVADYSLIKYQGR